MKTFHFAFDADRAYSILSLCPRQIDLFLFLELISSFSDPATPSHLLMCPRSLHQSFFLDLLA